MHGLVCLHSRQHVFIVYLLEFYDHHCAYQVVYHWSFNFISLMINVFEYIYAVCVCVWERERDREREREREREAGEDCYGRRGRRVDPACGFCVFQRTSDDCSTRSKQTTQCLFFSPWLHPLRPVRPRVSYVYFKCLLILPWELPVLLSKDFIRQQDPAFLRGKPLTLRSCTILQNAAWCPEPLGQLVWVSSAHWGCISPGPFARASPVASTRVTPPAETALKFHHSDAKKYSPASAMT